MFVNVDEIAKRRWPGEPAAHAYRAALNAEKTGVKLIELGRPFIAETVFSHPSKLELIATARGTGYTLVLPVPLIPEELTVQRVAYRVKSGGYPVAENKIRQHYHRLWAVLAEAIVRCEQATVYDNSGLNGPRMVAQLTDGFIVAPHLAGLETAAVNHTLAEVIDRRLRTS